MISVLLKSSTYFRTMAKMCQNTPLSFGGERPKERVLSKAGYGQFSARQELYVKLKSEQCIIDALKTYHNLIDG